MVIADLHDAQAGAPDTVPPPKESLMGDRTPTQVVSLVVRSAVVIGVIGFLAVYVGWGSMASTLIKVAVAVGLSALVFVTANKIFDQAYPRWAYFNALCGFAIGLASFGVLESNGVFRRLIDPTMIGDTAYDLNPWLWGLIGGAALAVVMFLLAAPREQLARLPLSVAGFGAFGVLGYLAVREQYEPTINWGKLVVCTAVGAGLFGLYRLTRGGAELAPRTALTGAVIGFAVGVWGGGDIGSGNNLELAIATIVPGLALGIRIGLGADMTAIRRRHVDQRSRAWIFLLPALSFIAGGLLLPLIRNAWLSFRNKDGSAKAGFENYRNIFRSSDSFDLENWPHLFTSRLFFVACAFVILAVVAGFVVGRANRSGFERGGATSGLAYIGFFFAAVAVLASIRGAIFNNLWWVVVVTGLATVFGLAVAVLADRSRGENLAKSLIFLPMAISFVGAGVIWRFMYLARPPSKNQTGVMNSMWVFIGQQSLGRGAGHWIIAAVLVAFLAGLVLLVVRGIADQKGIMAGVSIGLALVVAYLTYLFLFPGLGGAATNNAGEVRGKPILFLEDQPFNNMWLMVVLIWVQTGFAMVIFSSAIKGVPAELTEAAKVDGATESQVFWKITIPQITPTIGVVVTTLIVTVMKVFDVVKVMTGGINDTQVIANDMISNAFANSNFGLGAALAMLLFIAVLPVMFVNIRRMQRAKV